MRLENKEFKTKVNTYVEALLTDDLLRSINEFNIQLNNEFEILDKEDVSFIDVILYFGNTFFLDRNEKLNITEQQSKFKRLILELEDKKIFSFSKLNKWNIDDGRRYDENNIFLNKADMLNLFKMIADEYGDVDSFLTQGSLPNSIYMKILENKGKNDRISQLRLSIGDNTNKSILLSFFANLNLDELTGKELAIVEELLLSSYGDFDRHIKEGKNLNRTTPYRNIITPLVKSLKKHIKQKKHLKKIKTILKDIFKDLDIKINNKILQDLAKQLHGSSKQRNDIFKVISELQTNGKSKFPANSKELKLIQDTFVNNWFDPEDLLKDRINKLEELIGVQSSEKKIENFIYDSTLFIVHEAEEHRAKGAGYWAKKYGDAIYDKEKMILTNKLINSLYNTKKNSETIEFPTSIEEMNSLEELDEVINRGFYDRKSFSEYKAALIKYKTFIRSLSIPTNKDMAELKYEYGHVKEMLKKITVEIPKIIKNNEGKSINLIELYLNKKLKEEWNKDDLGLSFEEYVSKYQDEYIEDKNFIITNPILTNVRNKKKFTYDQYLSLINDDRSVLTFSLDDKMGGVKSLASVLAKFLTKEMSMLSEIRDLIRAKFTIYTSVREREKLKTYIDDMSAKLTSKTGVADMKAMSKDFMQTVYGEKIQNILSSLINAGVLTDHGKDFKVSLVHQANPNSTGKRIAVNFIAMLGVKDDGILKKIPFEFQIEIDNFGSPKLMIKDHEVYAKEKLLEVAKTYGVHSKLSNYLIDLTKIVNLDLKLFENDFLIENTGNEYKQKYKFDFLKNKFNYELLHPNEAVIHKMLKTLSTDCKRSTLVEILRRGEFYDVVDSLYKIIQKYAGKVATPVQVRENVWGYRVSDDINKNNYSLGIGKKYQFMAKDALKRLKETASINSDIRKIIYIEIADFGLLLNYEDKPSKYIKDVAENIIFIINNLDKNTSSIKKIKKNNGDKNFIKQVLSTLQDEIDKYSNNEKGQKLSKLVNLRHEILIALKFQNYEDFFDKKNILKYETAVIRRILNPPTP